MYLFNVEQGDELVLLLLIGLQSHRLVGGAETFDFLSWDQFVKFPNRIYNLIILSEIEGDFRWFCNLCQTRADLLSFRSRAGGCEGHL